MRKLLSTLLIISLLVMSSQAWILVKAEAITDTQQIILSPDFLDELEDGTILDAEPSLIPEESEVKSDLVTTILGSGWAANSFTKTIWLDADGNLTTNEALKKDAVSGYFPYNGPVTLSTDTDGKKVIKVTRLNAKQHNDSWTPRSGVVYSFETQKTGQGAYLTASADIKFHNLQSSGIAFHQDYKDYMVAFVGAHAGKLYINKSSSVDSYDNDGVVFFGEAELEKWYNAKLILNLMSSTWDVEISYESDKLPTLRAENDFTYSLSDGVVKIRNIVPIPMRANINDSRRIDEFVLGNGGKDCSSSYKNISIVKDSYTAAELVRVKDEAGLEFSNNGKVWYTDASSLTLDFSEKMPPLSDNSNINITKIETLDSVEKISYISEMSDDNKSYKLKFSEPLSEGVYRISFNKLMKDAKGNYIKTSDVDFTVTNERMYNLSRLPQGTTEAELKEMYPEWTFCKGGGATFSVGKPHENNTNALVMDPDDTSTDMPYIEIPFHSQTESFEISCTYGAYALCYPTLTVFGGEDALIKLGHRKDYRNLEWYQNIGTSEEKGNPLLTTKLWKAYDLNFGGRSYSTYTMTVDMVTRTFDITVKNPAFTKYTSSYSEYVTEYSEGLEIDTAKGTMTLKNLPLDSDAEYADKIRIGLMYTTTTGGSPLGIADVTIRCLGNNQSFVIDSVKFMDRAEKGAIKNILRGGEDLKVHLSAVNGSDAAAEFVPILAVYDDGGTLKNAGLGDKVLLDAKTAQNVEVSISKDDLPILSEEGDSARVFVWSDLSMLTPLSVFASDTSDTALSSMGRLMARELDKTPYIASSNDVTAFLTANEGKHPRLSVENKDSWSAINETLASDRRGNKILNSLIAEADDYLEEEMYIRPGSGSMEEGERFMGGLLRTLAGAYKLTGDEKYLNCALEWAETVSNLPYYGNASSDLAAGHILWGMGCFYDWCYDDIPEETRVKMRSSMLTQGERLYNAGHHGITWAVQYAQNHNHIAICGLLTAAMAIYDEPDAKVRHWIDYALDTTAISLALFGPEGMICEGVGYWAYGLHYLLETCSIMSDFFRIDVWSNSEWLKNTTYFRLQSSHPKAVWESDWRYNSLFFGDAWGYDFVSPPAVMYPLANRYGLETAQYFGNLYIDSGPEARLGEFMTTALWYDPTVGETPIDSLPETEYFEDAGLVVSRSGWSDDASMVAFKCGHFAGRTAAERKMSILEKEQDIGAGHTHPDQNHFYLIANGSILIRDDLYSDKVTGAHNTLLVDGKGQLGVDYEGETWFSETGELEDASLNIHSFEENDIFNYWVGDATQAYSSGLGLGKFERHMLHFKEKNALVVIDNISINNSKPLELRLFPQSEAVKKLSSTKYEVTTSEAKMHVETLTPENTSFTYERVPVSLGTATGMSGTRPALCIKNSSDIHWKNVTALTWSKAKETPSTVSMTGENGVYTLTIDSSTVVVDVNNCTAQAVTPVE